MVLNGAGFAGGDSALRCPRRVQRRNGLRQKLEKLLCREATAEIGRPQSGW